MDEQFENYIKSLLDYAKSNSVIVEAMKAFGMTWEEYEVRLRAYLLPPIFIYTTASTNDTAMTKENLSTWQQVFSDR